MSSEDEEEEEEWKVPTSPFSICAMMRSLSCSSPHRSQKALLYSTTWPRWCQRRYRRRGGAGKEGQEEGEQERRARRWGRRRGGPGQGCQCSRYTEN